MAELTLSAVRSMMSRTCWFVGVEVLREDEAREAGDMGRGGRHYRAKENHASSCCSVTGAAAHRPGHEPPAPAAVVARGACSSVDPAPGRQGRSRRPRDRAPAPPALAVRAGGSACAGRSGPDSSDADPSSWDVSLAGEDQTGGRQAWCSRRFVPGRLWGTIHARPSRSSRRSSRGSRFSVVVRLRFATRAPFVDAQLMPGGDTVGTGHSPETAPA